MLRIRLFHGGEGPDETYTDSCQETDNEIDLKDLNLYFQPHYKKRCKRRRCRSSGIQAQMVGSARKTVADDAAVVFDAVLTHQGTGICYNKQTGEFTLKGPGTYLVDWWVVTDGTAAYDAVCFSLRNNGCNIVSSSPIVTGQISGNALISSGSSPAVISLVNTSNDMVVYAGLSVQANIVITKVAV